MAATKAAELGRRLKQEKVRKDLRRNAIARHRSAAALERQYAELHRLVKEGKKAGMTLSDMAGAARSNRFRMHDVLKHNRPPKLAEASTFDSQRKEHNEPD